MTTPANPPAEQEGGPQGSLTPTPITDAALIDKLTCSEGGDHECTVYPAEEIVDAEVARTIERQLAQSEERVKALEGALRDAIWAADYLSEQQAMPDDGYSARLESARTLLSTSKTN